MRTRLTGALVAGLVALAVPGLAGPATAAAAEARAVGSSFVAVQPTRVLDTRNGTGGVPVAAVPARGTVVLNLSGSVPAGATAAVLNLVAADPTRATYVTAWRTGTARPAVSSLNVRARETRAIAVTVPVGSDRRVTLYNHDGNTHLVADLNGYYRTGDGAWFTSVVPERVLDTRNDGRPLPGGTSRTVRLAGLVPAGTTAVVLNVTGVRPDRYTYLSVFPDGQRPRTSSLNLTQNEITANLVTVAVDEDLEIAVANHVGSVHVLADLVGHYSGEGDAFHPITPVRAHDTRQTRWLTPGTQRRVDVGGAVPAETVVFTLTGLSYFYGGYLTAWEAGTPRPGTSTLNLNGRQTASNLAVVPVGVQRAVDVYNHADHTHVVVDVVGYFAPRAS